MNDAGEVAFRAELIQGVSGIFVADGGAIEMVADTEGPWSQFHGLPVINKSGAVVFRADRKDGLKGIYAADAGSIRTVVETGDVFQALGHFPSVNDHGTVAFAATLRSAGGGIFCVDEGRVTQICDTDGAFEAYRGALITGDGAVVRIATPRGGRLGLFSGSDPMADRILALGDALFGSTVAELASNPVSVSGTGYVVIRARLENDRQLILRVDPRRQMARDPAG
jgi:hypothetical protein